MPRPAPVDVTREIDRLYTLPLADFTRGRDELRTRLRALGAAEAAEHVRRLRRPTITAWVLNRLARAAPARVEEVLEAGGTLRRLHEDLLSGQAVDLLAADRALGDAIAAAVEAARRDADEVGAGGPALADRLRSTLRAAALDPAVGELVRAGRLDHERTPPVLGGPIGAAPAAAAPAPEPPVAPPEADPELLARLQSARERLDAASAAAADAAREEAEAGRAATEAAARRGALQEEADAATEAAARAAEAREAAARALEEAVRVLEEATGARDAARARLAEAAAAVTAAETRRADAAARRAGARDALAAAEAAARELLGP
ncbi:MAG TPA: hypothetical protein VNT51_11340 [Miltoncostaeaceae bacterium]|nr:hypothetical protein [Miltoncostaeaceae bacterium]